MGKNLLHKLTDFTKKKIILPTAIASTMFFSGCEMFEPPVQEEVPYSNNNPALNENARVIEDLNFTRTYNPGDVVLEFSEPLDDSYFVGMYLGSEPRDRLPYGLSVRLNVISQDRMSAMVYQVPLDNIIETGTLDFNGDLTQGDVDEKSSEKGYCADGVKLKSASSWGFGFEFNNVLYDTDGNSNTTNDQGVINGELYFDLNTSLHFNIGNKLSASAGIIANGHAEIYFEAEEGLNFSKEIPVWEKYLRPRTIWVSGWPVVLVPKVDILVGANADLESKIYTGITDDLSASAEISWTSGAGWNFSKEFYNDFNFIPPEIDLNLSAEAYAKIRASLLVYGGPGISGSVKASLDLGANILGNPWWDLNGCLSMNMGIDPSFLSSIIPEYEKEILNITEDIADAGGPFSDGGPGEEDLEGKIVFNSKSSNTSNYHIYTINANGSNQNKLTFDNWNISPVWHPTKDKIAYSTRPGIGEGNLDIYLMNSDGSNNEALVSSGMEEDNPCFSNDGSFLFFTAGYAVNSQVYKKDLESNSEPIKIIDESEFYHWDLCISPLGNKLAFSSNREGSPPAIYTSDLNGNNIKKITKGNGYDRQPSFSPDGNYIIFQSSSNNQTDLFMIDSYGNFDETPITDTPSISEESPSFSPDGTKIIFSSDESSTGVENIYIMNLDGSEKKELTQNYSSSSPKWKE